MEQRATSYEIYVLQRGRWELHARHTSTKRDAAIEEAKGLERLPNIEQVRVVRDVYNPDTGKSSEYTVYKTHGAHDDVVPRGGFGGGGEVDIDIADMGDDDMGGDFGDPGGGRQKLKSGVMTKLLILALTSFVVAFLVMTVFTIAAEEVRAVKAFIGRDHYADVQIGLFLITFAVSMALSSYAFLSKDDVTGEAERKRFEREEARLFREATKPKYQVPASKARNAEAGKAGGKNGESTGEGGGEGQNDDEDEFAVAKAEDAGEAPAAAEDSAGKKKLSVKADRQKVVVMSFLSKGLESVMQKRPKLDNYNKFGVNLYLAGACEAIGGAEGLSEEEVSTILAEGVQVLGTDPAQAREFAKKIDSYLLDPKHLSMIEAGRDAMAAQLKGDESAPQKLDKALDGWNTRKGDDSSSSGTIAVLFTDIVGSTNMTQTHGDAAAQEVVRTHNRIVRAALTHHQGREVKHTGDGIMASFQNTANAVEAAIYIQRQVAASNTNNPEVPLGVKIGINAGEPIVEDNDLFGTTVQLAARIVDKASNYQILVSETVKGICQGKSIEFVNRGAREMKGFKDPITLYEAVWGDGAPTQSPPPSAQRPPPAQHVPQA